MTRNVTAGIQEHFADLTDPQRRKVIYPLINIVTIDRHRHHLDVRDVRGDVPRG